ncbi:CbrC family protein [Streptomyces sp. NPDC048550]|uniref:CbrC family protein n=1 Tax=unclassified Streptomyces TaxID=2593676 RepID=UPI0034260F87
MYTAAFCSAHEVSGRFRPWCIADGNAAERFDGEFTDSYGLDGVSEDVLHEVTRRTPGFHTWQDPHWLVHCHEAWAKARPPCSSAAPSAPSTSPTPAHLEDRLSSRAPGSLSRSPGSGRRRCGPAAAWPRSLAV